MRAVGEWVAAVAMALLCVGVAALLLTPAPFTRALSERFSLADQAGLTRAQSLRLAEEVRAFVVEGSGSLPETVQGRPGFDREAVSHLADVGGVFSSARIACVLLALGIGAWIAVTVRRGHRESVGAALVRAAALCAVLVVVAVILAFADFERFFAAFHGLFFAEGTWVFPYDSLLIRLFPEPFWTWSGLAWGTLVMVLAACCWVVGAGLRRQE